MQGKQNLEILIVEESLRGHEGHWFDYISSITNELQRKEHKVTVLGHQKVISEFKNKLHIIPTFKQSYYLDQNKNNPLEKYIKFLTHSLKIYPAIFRHLKRNHYNLIFLPTVTMHHLLAWWFILILQRKAFLKVVMLFLTPAGMWQPKSKSTYFPKQTIILKFLLRLLKSKKIIFGAQTITAKEEFESLSGIRFHLLPQPVKLFSFKYTAQPKIIFGMYGYTRHEKGYDLVIMALSKILDNLPANVEFWVQWTKDIALMDGDVVTIPNKLLKSDKLKIIPKPLMPEEYLDLLSKTSCVLLPYRNSSYYSRDSRIAIEASMAGIPAIYTRDGWLDWHFQQFGAGVSFEDENVDSLIEAILTLINNYPENKKQAQDKIETATSYYHVENFTSKLLSFMS